MIDLDKVLQEYEPEGDPLYYLAEAEELVRRKMMHEAASVIDRAYCIDPLNEKISLLRKDILDQLSISEHGIDFQYIPAGTYLMGSDNGEPDESPAHPVFTSSFWISNVPISWEIVCDILGCGKPPDIDFDILKKDESFMICRYKIILQYCEDSTLHAKDWHCHVPQSEEDEKWASMFPPPKRIDSNAPYIYRKKPVVALSWNICMGLCKKLSNDKAQQYTLPTEAEWEKAARGGLHGKRYSWGNELPNERADCERFLDFSVLPSRTFPANGYGLYAVCGGVSEWTQDWYDEQYYSESPRSNPIGPSEGKAKVLRGGSWGDCPEACTVSFRMAVPVREEPTQFGGYASPNIGFRICRRN